MADQPESIAPYTRVRYLGIGDITLYAVTDDDLHTLERGGGASTLLALWTFFASVAISFLASFLVSDINSLRVFIVFVVLIIGCAIAAIITFVLWKRASGDLKATIARIRERGMSRSAGEVIEGPETR
jgi:hypothetical protein